MAGNLRTVRVGHRRELRGHTIVLFELPSRKVQSDSCVEDVGSERACKHEEERRVRHVVLL